MEQDLSKLKVKDLHRIVKHFEMEKFPKRKKKQDLVNHIVSEMKRKKLKHKDISGAGFFDSIKKLGSKIVSGTKSLTENIKGRFSGERSDYPPDVRKWFSENGTKIITSITIYRKPVNSAIINALNIISFGDFKNKMAQLGFDRFFHLYLKLTYGNNESAIVEKNEVINISGWRDKYGSDEAFPISYIPPNVSVNQFFQKGQALLGDNYFKYNALSYNCQNYVMSLLQANGLLTSNPQAKEFIYQDVNELAKDLPQVSKFASAVTGLASKFNTLLYGKGLYV
jgi:hypothetical protein